MKIAKGTYPRKWTGFEGTEGRKIEAVLDKVKNSNEVSLTVFDPYFLFARMFPTDREALECLKEWAFDNHVELTEVTA